MAKNFIGAVLGMNTEGWTKGCNNAAKDSRKNNISNYPLGRMV